MVSGRVEKLGSRKRSAAGRQKRALLVLGMHRSGTSAFARSLGLLGCDLPTTLMPAGRGNEQGHWESQPITDLNEEILASAGSSWDDWGAFNPDWYVSPVVDEFRERAQAALESEFGASRLFVLKDPRVCRLLDFWIEATKAFGATPLVVSPIRNPLEVAASLHARDGMEPSIAQLLWLRHVLDAEAASRNLRRTYVRYDDLLSEWRVVADKIGDDLGISWPRRSTSVGIEIEEFLTPAQRHHVEKDARVLRNPSLSRWIQSTFEILNRWAHGEVRETDTADLDRIRASFDEAAPAFSRPIVVGQWAAQRSRALEAELEQAQAAVTERDGQIDSLTQAVAERDGQIDSLTQAVAERDGQIAELNQAVAERDGQIDSLTQGVAERDGQIDSLTQAVAERDGQIDSLNQAVAEHGHALHEIWSSRSWRVTRPLRYMGRSARGCLSAFRRAAHLIKIISTAILNAPAAVSRWGLGNLLFRIFKRYQEEGLRGIARRAEAFATLRTQEISKTQSVSDEAQPVIEENRLQAVPQRSAYKVAYIVNSSDLMTQVYRVVNYSEALMRRGHECAIHHADDISVDTDIDADVLVLNRIVWSPEIETLVQRFQSAGRPVFFDIDDFVIDPSQIDKLRHTKDCSAQERAELLGFMERLAKTMQLCNAATASTFALKTEIEKRGKPAYVLPNSIGAKPLELAKSMRKAPPSLTAPHARVRVAYFSGTKTHQRDFIECAEAVRRVLAEQSQVEFLIVGHLDLPSEFDAFQGRVICKPLMPYQDMLKELATVDVNLAPLELGNIFTDCKSELKVFEAALFGIPTIASPTSSIAAIIDHGRTGYLAACEEEWHEALTKFVKDPALRMRVGEAAREEIASRYAINTAILEAEQIYGAALARQLRKFRPLDTRATRGSDPPKITVISVLYRKAREVRYFLEALRRQDFPGRYEVLLVDDRSPDESVHVVEDFKKWMACAAQKDDRMDIRILINEKNVGNCCSRNAAIREARGDILVVVDADCMLNRSCLSAHYEALSAGRYDVAIGPMNIETNNEAPLSVLNRYEATTTLGAAKHLPQDPINLDSFVNCVTRNFSIRRAFLEGRLEGQLFDETFSYSADPASGFGWEDVEMGYRIYAAGGRIKYLPDTVSIHVSHESLANESEKPIRSLRNYRRLFQKHPDILYASRPWAIHTWEAIVGWAESVGAKLDDNADYQWLERRFRRYGQAPIIIDRSRKLKVLTYCWHVPHQYELYKLGHQFTLVTGTGTAMCDSWKWDKRPLPRNCEMVPVDRVDVRDFDLAILHFDENVLRSELCCGKVPDDWGHTFLWFINNVDLPKVGVCHGTPQFKGQYDGNYKYADLGQTIAENREELVRLLANVTVVCNSYQACHEWGFSDSLTIWHGFSPHEYRPGTHERGVLSMARVALTNRPHYNGLFINDRVRALVANAVPFTHLNVPNPAPVNPGETQEWAMAKYQNYLEELRHYSIYLNPTQRSPMPRSRGEAMMAGLVSVSLRNHDVDLFVRNGVNGFYSDDPEELADQILFLSRDDAARRRMAAASRRTVLDLFNQDRYLAAWSALIKRVLA